MREVESAPDWFSHKLSTESSKILVKIASVVWGVWWARNKRVWEGKVVTPKIAMDWSYKQIFEWREARRKKDQISLQRQEDRVQHSSRWVAPVAGTLKLNIDASVFEGAESFSIGLVIRNQPGVFLQDRTMSFAGRVGVLEAELVGIQEALKWTAEFQDQNFYVEGDSLLKGSKQLKGIVRIISKQEF